MPKVKISSIYDPSNVGEVDVHPTNIKTCGEYKSRKSMIKKLGRTFHSKIPVPKIFSINEDYKTSHEIASNELITRNYQKKLIDCMLHTEKNRNLKFCVKTRGSDVSLLFHERKLANISVLSRNYTETNLIEIVCGFIKYKPLNPSRSNSVNEMKELKTNLVFTTINNLFDYEHACIMLDLKYTIIKDKRSLNKFIYYLLKIGSKPKKPIDYNTFDVILIKDSHITISYPDLERYFTVDSMDKKLIYNIITVALRDYYVRGRVFIDIINPNSRSGIIKKMINSCRSEDIVQYPKCSFLWFVLSKIDLLDDFHAFEDSVPPTSRTKEYKEGKSMPEHSCVVKGKYVNHIVRPYELIRNYYLLNSVSINKDYMRDKIYKKEYLGINFMYYIHENVNNDELTAFINNETINRGIKNIMYDYFEKEDYKSIYDMICTNIGSEYIKYYNDVSVKSVYNILEKSFAKTFIKQYRKGKSFIKCIENDLKKKEMESIQDAVDVNSNKILSSLKKSFLNLLDKNMEKCVICHNESGKSILNSINTSCPCNTTFCSMTCCLRGCFIVRDSTFILDRKSSRYTRTKCPNCRRFVGITDVKHMDKSYKDSEEFKIVNQIIDGYKNKTIKSGDKSGYELFHKLIMMFDIGKGVVITTKDTVKNILSLKPVDVETKKFSYASQYNRENVKCIGEKPEEKISEKRKKKICGNMILISDIDKETLNIENSYNIAVCSTNYRGFGIGVNIRRILVVNDWTPESVRDVAIHFSPEARNRTLTKLRKIEDEIIVVLQTMKRRVKLNIHYIIYRRELKFLRG